VFKNSPQCTACTTLCTESRMPSSTIDMCCSDWWEKCENPCVKLFSSNSNLAVFISGETRQLFCVTNPFGCAFSKPGPGGLLPKFAETVCYALTSTPSPATLVTTFSPTSPATVETKSSDEHNLIVMWDLAKICVIIVVIVIVIIIVVAVCKVSKIMNTPK
jgi:hypothetical protein